MKFVRTHLVDKAPWWVTLLLALAYFFSAFVCIGVGGTGPGPLAGVQPALESGTRLNCANPMDCSVAVKTSFKGLSGYNQAMWINAVINRPTDTTIGAPALPNAAVSWEQEYTIDAVGVAEDGSVVPLAQNLTKTTTVRCEPNRISCSGAALFRQAFIYYKDYQISATFKNPNRVWIDQGLPIANLDRNASVNITLRGGYIAREYTAFQVNSKYTFMALTIVVLGIYITSIVIGRGNRDPRDGRILEMSSDQVWVLILGIMLFWYNDPTVIVNVTRPTFVVSGFYAFCATTFIATLMLYWLVTFDTARSGNGSSGQAAAGPSARLANRFHCSAVAAALVFWVPKLVWVCISWVLVLGFYAVSRAAWLSDPAFDIFAAFPFISQYFTSFLGAWGGIYVIYLVILIAMGWYNCRLMTPAGRWINFITVLSMLGVLAGYFGNSILPVNASNSSVAFMVAYGVINPYIWFLLIAYMPVYSHSKLDMVAQEAMHAADVASGKAAAVSESAPYGGVASQSIAKDTQTLLSLDANAANGALDVPITIDQGDKVLYPRAPGANQFSGSAGGGAAAATIPVPQEAVPDVEINHHADEEHQQQQHGHKSEVAPQRQGGTWTGVSSKAATAHAAATVASPADVTLQVSHAAPSGTAASIPAATDGIQWQQQQQQQAAEPAFGDDGMIDPFAAEGAVTGSAHTGAAAGHVQELQ